MEDKLLIEFFKPDRWSEAIETGVLKGMNKAELRALTSPDTRLRLLQAISMDMYEIAPPHQALIPKDNGDFRTVYVNENIDRLFLSIVNNILFDFCKDMVHPTCKSYQSGIGCGKVVKEAVRYIERVKSNTIGMKLDLTKYFDTVSIQFIDKIFQEIEKRTGRSKIIDILMMYYHSDLCFDVDDNLIEQYQSLKQGCAVASFLADAMLFEMDKEASEMGCYYVRYSDDILIIGNNYQKTFDFVSDYLSNMGMSLNPKKVERLSKDKWFKFLGFNIKGDQITLSKNRVKSFQSEIEKRTIKRKHINMANAVRSVNKYLYKGDGQYSWATSVLPIINVEKDINTLNAFVMDAIRACETGKKKIGGLGSTVDGKDFTIQRGIGKNVSSNKEKTPKEIPGYMSIGGMQNVINFDRDVYNTIILKM